MGVGAELEVLLGAEDARDDMLEADELGQDEVLGAQVGAAGGLVAVAALEQAARGLDLGGEG